MMEIDSKLSVSPRRCGFYVKRKSRFCKMKPATGNKYCAEHLINDEEYKGTLTRVQCPLDPKHSVFRHKLEKHLKKCNALGKTQQSFYEENINAGDAAYIYPYEETAPLSSVSNEELNGLIKRLKETYNSLKEPTTLQFLEHKVLADELGKEEYGPSTRKHLTQQAAIISLLEKNGALSDGSCFLEFGAGKGKLMHWVEKAMPTGSKANFYLIDRQNNRHKFDCYHKGGDQESPFNRLYIDIKDLNLEKVQGLRDHRMTTSIGKHLCGAATDFTLRCLLQESSASEENTDTGPPLKKLKTALDNKSKNCLPDLVLVALCCHHRCTWPSYVGKNFFLKHGFTSLDFHRLSSLTSWALCGFRHRDHDDSLENDSMEDKKEAKVSSVSDKASKAEDENKNGEKVEDIRLLSKEEKEDIGRIAKRLIDYGRLEYLRASDYVAELAVYVPEETTPENIVLLARKQKGATNDESTAGRDGKNSEI